MNQSANFPDNANYRQVIRGFLQLHQLTVEGRDESSEADAVRDSLDLPWRALTTAEKDQVQGLSADLFSISDPLPDAPIEKTPQAKKNLSDAEEATQQRKWYHALELLRRLSKYLAPALLTYLRGRIWLEAGYPEVATVFWEHSTRLDPENSHCLGMFLHLLLRNDPQRALARVNQILREPEKYSPSIVVEVCGVKFNSTRNLSETDTAIVLHDLISVLMNVMLKIPEDNNSYLTGLTLLAFIHERLGEADKAFEYYSQGLRIEPFHDGLLTGRGILTYGKNPQSLKDLEQAIKQGTQLVWPYFFLAHHYIVNDRYEECRQMCERGLQMKALPAVLSQLLEWLAIAEAELGLPPEKVQAAFEEALRLDPSNEKARKNLERFMQAIIPSKPISNTWDKRSYESVRLQFGPEDLRGLVPA